MNHDTFNCLLPTIRKNFENKKSIISKEITDGEICRSKALRGKQAKHITQVSRNLKPDVFRSSSSIFKKITNKFPLQEFSISNLFIKKRTTNNISIKDNSQKLLKPAKQVIKITVVPIKKEVEISNINLQRKLRVRRVHKTVSNTHVSIKDNVLYLPKTRRGIHNIRETSSVELFSPGGWKRNEATLNRLTYIKTILNSLNMYQKEREEAKFLPKSTKKTYKSAEYGCACDNNKLKEVLDDMNSQKNRVTIVGRVGLNENDQYVLNCAATVGNKSIKTNLSSASIDHFENNDDYNKMSRATQADINNCFSSHDIKQTKINNSSIHCPCKNTKDVATTISQFRFGDKREHKSPLIVISVYPTKDTMDDLKELSDIVQIDHLQESQRNDKNRQTPVKTRPDQWKVITSTAHKTTAGPFEKRSSSPPFKTFDKEKLETCRLRNRSTSPTAKDISNDKVDKTPRSRSRSPSGRNTAKEILKCQLNHRTSQKAFKTASCQDRLMRGNNAISQKERLIRKPIIVSAAQTSKIYPFQKPYAGIKESDKVKSNKIKKAIIDSYTQHILRPAENRDETKIRGVKNPNLKSNASTLTIDIDGDNELYRVLLFQNKLSTDLSVRRTLKSQESKKPNECKVKKKDNNFKGTMKIHGKETKVKKSVEKPTDVNQLDYSGALAKKISGFKIRDSLEIRHGREHCNDHNKKDFDNSYQPTVKIQSKNKKNNGHKKDFSASIKHYRGDQCSVPNPALRDQEIRDLLGITKPRSRKFEFIEEVLPEFIGQNVHCNLRPVKCFSETRNKINMHEKSKLISASTQCDNDTINSYKQMILNRNIQVFLEVEQFTKQKPIMLSQKQYEKVKKTIQKKVSKKISLERRRLNNSTKFSVVSIGETRKTRKQLTPNMNINKPTQVNISTGPQNHRDNDRRRDNERNKSLLILHSAEKNTKHDTNLSASPRQVVSSMELRYASTAHLRQVTFSSSNIKKKEPGSFLYNRKKDCSSTQIIFKGHKKCVTPNLGTSGYSLYSDEDINSTDNNYTFYRNGEKQKKPLLKRLMSCLVMRSTRKSEAILPKQYEQPSNINSFDSYHISTSLAAIELTSLYDTSASFYSNHTILPVARIKQGFISSVRGFLTNLKSR